MIFNTQHTEYIWRLQKDVRCLPEWQNKYNISRIIKKKKKIIVKDICMLKDIVNFWLPL